MINGEINRYKKKIICICECVLFIIMYIIDYANFFFEASLGFIIKEMHSFRTESRKEMEFI